jgi:hypothetical protein
VQRHVTPFYVAPERLHKFHDHRAIYKTLQNPAVFDDVVKGTRRGGGHVRVSPRAVLFEGPPGLFNPRFDL